MVVERSIYESTIAMREEVVASCASLSCSVMSMFDKVPDVIRVKSLPTQGDAETGGGEAWNVTRTCVFL